MHFSWTSEFKMHSLETLIEIRAKVYFREQGLAVGIQECLERFYRGCVDYLRRQFVPKWDSPNFEGELVTACTAPLLVELVGVAA